MTESEGDNAVDGIAIIGMSGRFPGAATVEQLWQNLTAGVESISFFSREELEQAGVDPTLLQDPSYVRARGVLADVERFDAEFFGFSAREAALTDPQQRLFLECSFEALERAGYGGEHLSCPIGVYAGSGGGMTNTYLWNNIYPRLQQGEPFDEYQLSIANEKDFLSTRVSYKLNLRGPSVVVQTACSTSLVAVYIACQGLSTYQCDMALAGGVAVSFPQERGYFFREGMILSPDGHCRPFDAEARGTVSGHGVGVVLLKRLADALADGDPIYAVIRGAAANNDGSAKVGFTAPGVDGQVEVILQALSTADIEPESIGYVEAHGTGTRVGDPIEIESLTQAFHTGTRKNGFCAIGSAKSNLGHLDTAAGVTGLIKATLALAHGQIPPSLHFESPNPRIDFANSPFYVNTALAEWKRGATPRRAGVSSFGIGGTNAHVILEEAPVVEPSGPSRPWQLVTLSARTSSALDRAAENLAEHLERHPSSNLADVAYTLHVGRREFTHRRMVVARDIEELKTALSTRDPRRVFTCVHEPQERSVAFMFSGQGSQYVNATLDLYRHERVYREEIDRCAELLLPHSRIDFRKALYPTEDGIEEAAMRLSQTALAQPTLFAIEYALAKLWMSWGVHPSAMVGHSLGEYVAACLAGVFSLEDALRLVAARGRLMQELPGGAMFGVPLSKEEITPLLGDEISIAAINTPSICVVSGPEEAALRFVERLSERGVSCRRLHNSHAFHSAMMDPIIEPFAAEVRKVRLHAPKLPYLSGVTGDWITAEDVTTPTYWTTHLRETVRFSDCLTRLFEDPKQILVEIGPGRALCNLARRHAQRPADQVALASLRHPDDPPSDMEVLLDALGKCWLEGLKVDWSTFHAGERRRRIRLPTYPFERQRYWIEPLKGRPAVAAQSQRGLPMDLEGARAHIETLEAEEPHGERYPSDFKATCDALCSSYIYEFLRSSGLELRRDARLGRRELLSRLRVSPKYEKFFGFFIETLANDGIVRVDGDAIEILQDEGDIPAAGPLRQELSQRFPEFTATLAMLEDCVKSYGSALSGDEDPQRVLHPDGGYDRLAPILETMLEYTSTNAYLNLAVRTLLYLLGPARSARARILEVGGGNGHLTWPLAERLRGRGVEYHFTDMGRYFVVNAERRALREGLDFMRFGTLDISRAPAEQGYEPGSFDVVVGYNVVHATRRLEETIAHLKGLLAPHGLLLLVEATRARREHTMIWGLEEGWWYFEDEDLRQTSPLMTATQWESFLRPQGFEGLTVLPRGEEGRQAADHALLLAQMPAQGAPSTRSEDAHTTPTRSAAAAWVHPRPKLANDYIAPRNDLERRLVEIWQRVLGTELGVYDNFFDVGGDSLLAIQLLSRLREEFGISLPAQALLSTPTVASLAVQLEGSG